MPDTIIQDGPSDAAGAAGNATAASPLEARIARTGDDLLATVGAVLDAVPDRPAGPQALARRISIDKVLASRVLKAMRSPDAMSAMHRMPGPEPLRRILRAASKLGVAAVVVGAAGRAVDEFERLIRDDLGDRGALDAIVAAWVPEARREFELRRKQSAYKAMSQLKGVHARAILATAIIHPAADGKNLDIVWLTGLIGLHRLRPRAGVKLATRRMAAGGIDRQPRTLDGARVEEIEDAMLTEFTSKPRPRLAMHHAGEVVHYSLAQSGFGPTTAVDLVIAEANIGEMRRTIDTGEERKSFYFAEVSLPAKVIQFDTILHRDVYPGSDAVLRLYDTAFEGVADINDPSRDIDQLDLLESIEPLGTGVERIGSSTIPHYGRIIQHVCDRMQWDRRVFRAYRCHIDYPVYGTQIAMCFDPPRG